MLKVKYECERYIANINNKIAKFLKYGLHSTIILTIIKTIIITIIMIIIIIIRIMGKRKNVHIQMPMLIMYVNRGSNFPSMFGCVALGASQLSANTVLPRQNNFVR